MSEVDDGKLACLMVACLIIGALLGGVLVGVSVQSDWERLAVGHGAAHYTTDGKFEWNGGKDK